jgi:hypothetical protein
MTMRPFTQLLLLFGTALVILVPGCEDPPPNQYTPEPFVEAFLFVDRPITDVAVCISQPLTEPFDYGKSIVSDAHVSISSGGERYDLRYRANPDLSGTYYCPDSTILIKPETVYALRVEMPDGIVMTAETVTPPRIYWVKPPAGRLQYPQDTVSLPSPDSLRISWTAAASSEYLIRVRCLDTLAYGAYLQPSTTELNGRTNNLAMFEGPDDPSFNSVVRWGYVQSSSVPTVWTAFRWYGKHDVAVLAPDKWFLSWFKATQWAGNVQYNRQYSNISGGLGIFASASMAQQQSFVLKRK